MSVPFEGASIAIDLGAESCRVSLLRWIHGDPVITLVHRFPNVPRQTGDGIRWDLSGIEANLDEGLRRCAAMAREGVRSLAVDGWGVDYVRVNADGRPLADPYCYRDERTVAAMRLLHRRIAAAALRELTGVQILRINTLYQLYADLLDGLPRGATWLNIPEYILSRWGGEPVAEYTNATHSALIKLGERQWSPEIFSAAGLDLGTAARIVPAGAVVGRLQGEWAQIPSLCDSVLIAPACHDTASAVAGIPAAGNDWAYVSSGTWLLVGTLLDRPRNGERTRAENFTNLGAVGGQFCFHKNVNGMWLVQECMRDWAARGMQATLAQLIKEAERLPEPEALLEVDDADLLLPGQMPRRINAQLSRRKIKPLDDTTANAPAFMNLILHSLAARVSEVLDLVMQHTGKRLKRIFVVGGGSQNEFLNRLIAETSELEVSRGSPESSTIGNFSVQLSVLEGKYIADGGVSQEDVSRWALRLGEPGGIESVAPA